MDKEVFSEQTENPLADVFSRVKYYREHILQYALLALSFVVSLTILAQLTGLLAKAIGIFIISAFYLLWGVWHHLEEKNLTKDHFFEYLLMSVLTFIILAFIFVI